MKISDEISLSARNLLRRKGRTALTLVGVVIGTCMVVLMISLGIAQNQANDEMLQSWGDLTQIEIYNGGISIGSDGKTIKCMASCRPGAMTGTMQTSAATL